MNVIPQSYQDLVIILTILINFVTHRLILIDISVSNKKIIKLKKVPKRYPEWVNTKVIVKALKMREEGTLSNRLNMWIENLLEIDDKR